MLHFLSGSQLIMINIFSLTIITLATNTCTIIAIALHGNPFISVITILILQCETEAQRLNTYKKEMVEL
jgi:hypothetical protein